MDIKATLQNIATRGFWLDDIKKVITLFTWITTPKINDDGTIIVTIPEPVVPLLIKLTNVVFSLKGGVGGLEVIIVAPFMNYLQRRHFRKVVQ